MKHNEAMAKPVLLTVDDDAEVLRAVERDLRHEYGARFRVLRANSGESALDTVYRIVRKHHGEINFRSKPGDTCFQVRLPLTLSAASSMEESFKSSQTTP